jgi:hypothetical protein
MVAGMSTYNLFPGLKQILEDKRILRYGVPDAEYQNYLKAEQFVVDMRNMTEPELDDIEKTFNDLSAMGLSSPPYDNFVIHTINQYQGKYYDVVRDYTGSDIQILTFYVYRGCLLNDQRNILALFPSEENYRTALAVHEKLKAFYSMKSHESLAKLIVMLATRNIVKERKEPKASQAPVNGKPHKKGSGGYTLLRPPEAHEVGDGTGTHASPRPHFRRGHIRKLHPEEKARWIFVAPCFVNGEPEVMRKAYLA